MSSTIGATGIGSYATATAASAGQAASPTRADHHSALNQIVYRHQVGISRGENAAALMSFDKPITAAERTLREDMTLRKSAQGPAETGHTDRAPDTRHRLDATV
jgi:hypothetical protein